MDPFYRYLAEHHGVFSRSEALELGKTKSQLATMVRRGEIVRTQPATFRSSSSPRTWQSRLRSAALSADGLASHRAAAALWGIDGFPRALIEVTIPKDRRVVMPGVKVHRTTQFGLADPTTLDGIRTTGIARTVLDVAAVVGPQRLNQTVDAVLRQGLLDWIDLYDVLTRHSARGRNGCGRLRALLDVRFGETAIPDSRWNRMAGTLLFDAGLPEPVYEHEVHDRNGDFVARVDLAYRQQKLAIELDSARWHLNSESFTKDPRRKNKLTVLGWTVLTFTWADYVDRPNELINVVTEALRRP